MAHDITAQGTLEIRIPDLDDTKLYSYSIQHSTNTGKIKLSFATNVEVKDLVVNLGGRHGAIKIHRLLLTDLEGVMFPMEIGEQKSLFIYTKANPKFSPSGEPIKE